MQKLVGVETKTLLTGPRSAIQFGPPMSGKTTNLITLVEAGWGPLHVHDFDGKSQSLVRAAEKRGLLDQLVIYRYDSHQDKIRQSEYPEKSNAQFVSFMNTHNSYFDLINPTTGKWKDSATDAPGVIAFDTLTSLNVITLEFVLSVLGHDLGAPKTDSRSDYGKQMGKIMEIVRSAKALPCISIWNAHERFEKDDLTGQVRCEPSATGQLANQLAKEFNAVLYTSVVRNAANPLGASFEWYGKPRGWVTQAGSTEVDLPVSLPQDWSLVFGKKVTV
jgi:hypothetical protein